MEEVPASDLPSSSGNEVPAHDLPSQDDRKGGIGNNITAGINTAIANIVGAPVDLMSKALNPYSFNFTNKTKENTPAIARHEETAPIGGSESIKQAMGLINVNPDSYAARTTGERIARGAGEGLAGAVVPAMGAEAALANAWADSGGLANAALQFLKGSGAASNAAVGAAGGAGGEAAAEAAPDNLKPVARLVGGLVAGVGAGGAMAVGEAAGSAARHWWQSATESAEVQAARKILGNASDPGKFKADLNDLPSDLVEGSNPTTFQATGDLGVGALEQSQAAKPASVNSEGQNITPSSVAAFANRRAEQNAARLAEIKKLADPGARANAIADYIHENINANASRVEGASSDVSDALDTIGGTTPVDDLRKSITDYVDGRLKDITDIHAARVVGASDDFASVLDAAGGTAADNATAYGNTLRGSLKVLHDQAKTEANSLWRAIDPDLKTQVSVTPLKDLTDKLMSEIPQTAKPPGGEEAAIFDTIQGLGDSAAFGDLTALRSRLTDAIRQERQGGTPTVLRRLAITLGNLDTTLADTAGELVAKMPEAKQQSVFERLALEAKQWQNRAKASAENAENAGPAAGRSLEESAGGNAAPSAPAVPSVSGNEGENLGGSRIPPGDQGVQSGIADDVADRYRSARDATARLKGTFERGPVGATLKPGGAPGTFQMMPSNVPKNLFDKPEALEAYLKASGPEGAATMQDYAAFSLRQAAVRDGKLNPAKFENWALTHQAQLRQFPELKANLSNVGAAQKVLDEALTAQKDMVGAPEIFKAFPSNAPKNLFDKPEALQDFLKATGTDVEPRNAVQDYAAFSLRQAAVRNGQLMPAKFENWVATHQAQLRQFPELKAKLSNLGDAQKVLDDALAVQKQALTDYQESAAKHFLNTQNPTDSAMAALKRPEDFAKLVEQVKDSPAATAGLKRAVVDGMLKKTISTAEAGASGLPQIKTDALIKFIGENAEAMSKLFNIDEMTSISNIAEDLVRANRSIVAVKSPGRSDTAAILGGSSFLQRMVQHAAGKVVGVVAGTAVGHPIIGLVAGSALEAMRASRMNSLDKAITEMMLNPKMAAAGIAKIPAHAERSAMDTFAARMRALTSAQIVTELSRATRQ